MAKLQDQKADLSSRLARINLDDIEHPAAEKCYGDNGAVGSSSRSDKGAR